MGNVEIKFPVESLPEYLKNYVVEVSREYQTPQEMVFQSCLAAMSCATRNCWLVRTAKRYTETLQLWTMTLADPGERKGVMYEAFSPIKILEVLSRKEYNRRLFEYREKHEPRKKLLKDEVTKLQKEIRELEKQEDADKTELAKLKIQLDDVVEAIKVLVEPTYPTFVVSDTTPEALPPVMKANHEALAIADTEATFLKVVGGLYNGGKPNVGFLNKSYVCESDTIIRKSDSIPVTINMPFTAISMFIQTDVLAKLKAKNDFTDTGFMQRFLYALPSSPQGYRDVEPTAASSEVTQDWNNRLVELFEEATFLREDALRSAYSKDDLSILEFTEDARRIYVKYKEEFELRFREDGDFNGVIAGWASKFPGTIARIAACFALMDRQREKIDVEYLNAALGLAEFYIETAKHVWGVMDGTKGAGRLNDQKKRLVIEWIVKCAERTDTNDNLTKSFTASQIHQKVRRSKDSPFKHSEAGEGPKLVEKTLELLMNDSTEPWLDSFTATGKGRPTTKYQANIELLKLEFADEIVG